eukprot:7975770-Alexandrium_andersonii.AAC.1
MGLQGVGIQVRVARAVVLLHVAARLVDRDSLWKPRLAAWDWAAPAGVLVWQVCILLRVEVVEFGHEAQEVTVNPRVGLPA